MNYAEKLKDPRWQKKRLEVMQRDGFACKCCGDKETELHIHHKTYQGDPWDIKNEELDTLCKHCHLIIEYLKKKFLFKDVIFVYKTNDGGYMSFVAYLGNPTKGVFFFEYIDGKVNLAASFSAKAFKNISELTLSNTQFFEPKTIAE